VCRELERAGVPSSDNATAAVAAVHLSGPIEPQVPLGPPSEVDPPAPEKTFLSTCNSA
jgi:hypothetical protein